MMSLTRLAPLTHTVVPLSTLIPIRERGKQSSRVTVNFIGTPILILLFISIFLIIILFFFLTGGGVRRRSWLYYMGEVDWLRVKQTKKTIFHVEEGRNCPKAMVGECATTYLAPPVLI